MAVDINEVYLGGKVVQGSIKMKMLPGFGFLNFGIDTPSGRYYVNCSINPNQKDLEDKLNASVGVLLFPGKFKADPMKEDGVIIPSKFYWKVGFSISKMHMYPDSIQGMNAAYCTGKVVNQVGEWVVLAMSYKNPKNDQWKNEHVRIRCEDFLSMDFTDKRITVSGSVCATIGGVKKFEPHVYASHVTILE